MSARVELTTSTVSLRCADCGALIIVMPAFSPVGLSIIHPSDCPTVRLLASGGGERPIVSGAQPPRAPCPAPR